ncbi:MAG: hypothetical protein ACKD6N_03475 [Candidatus Bathyarchaeota archaeon]
MLGLDKLLEFRKTSREESSKAEGIFITNLVCLTALLILNILYYIQHGEFEPTILSLTMALIGHLTGMVTRSKT